MCVCVGVRVCVCWGAEALTLVEYCNVLCTFLIEASWLYRVEGKNVGTLKFVVVHGEVVCVNK